MSFLVLLEIGGLREALAAFIAFEWLVARMDSHMRRQVEVQGEATLAVREGAFEGTLASVH